MFPRKVRIPIFVRHSFGKHYNEITIFNNRATVRIHN
jgi:hypothetical protein